MLIAGIAILVCAAALVILGIYIVRWFFMYMRLAYGICPNCISCRLDRFESMKEVGYGDIYVTYYSCKKCGFNAELR